MSTYDRQLKAFGKNLKRLRQEKAITQEELAELTDFDPTYISLLERGLRNPPLTTIYLLSEALKVEPTLLVKLKA